MMKQNKRPYECEVEYLESDNSTNVNNAWIDTGLFVTDNDNDFYISFQLISTPTYAHLWGAYKNDSSLITGFLNCKSNNLHAYNNTNAGQKAEASANFLEVNDSVLLRNGVCYIGDSVFEPSGMVSNRANPEVTLKLFRSNYGSAPHSRIFKFKWVKGDDTILDMIPVRVGSEGFMYDKVSGKLFGNSGSGSFILGSDIK